jgi:adenylate kinase family enzyme
MKPKIPALSLGERTIVIGNSGSGKSTLARQISERLSVPAIDLDTLHWETAGCGLKRDEKVAARMAAQAALKERWVIEGVYGWLAAVAAPRATALIWLDLSWSECRTGLIERGPRRGADADAFAELHSWGETYWSRSTSSSHEGHRRMYETFASPKLRLQSRGEIDEFLARI